jgi:hypothetical protein
MPLRGTCCVPDSFDVRPSGMATRRQLQDVASGLLGSFVSRNNDVGGYWGIGRLCQLAEHCRTDEVNLDFVEGAVVPASSIFDRLLAGYAARLAGRLSSQGIPPGWVRLASINLNFDPRHPLDRRVPISTWGKLYRASVVIEDDKGKCHQVTTYGYCAPHDQTRESKSGGDERY